MQFNQDNEKLFYKSVLKKIISDVSSELEHYKL